MHIFRSKRTSTFGVVASLSFVLASIASAHAGMIADENAKPGAVEDWFAKNDGTAVADGVVDVYPASWSIARGEPLRLKVRSTSGYSVHVYRLGWYGGRGARAMAEIDGLPADVQPYPTADADTGIAAAGWHDSVTVATDAGWTPGTYAVRVDQTSGKQASTYFVVRDDGLPARPPILLVVGSATHEAYNAWPGMARGGKSLYGFNSSSTIPAQADGLNQAVKVSYDRPFLVGAGIGDFPNYEYPFVRWLERNGWDVAYATDQDLHDDPSLATGRAVVTWAGHWEYVSRAERDHVKAARDAGTNLLFLTGDTISWQVRFEAGTQTLVGYKENWPKDPEELAGEAALAAGDRAGAIAHFLMVSQGWRSVGSRPSAGIDLRDPGMTLSGLHSGGGFGPDGPWGDLVIEAPDHWLFAGTGFKKGDHIEKVMGYEFDTAELGDPAWDPFRPAGQVILGTIVRRSTGEARGNAAYYEHGSAEVVAMGAVDFAWALDGFASTWGDPTDPRVGVMITNALTRWTAHAPPPPSDAGVSPDAGPPDAADDTGVATDSTVGIDVGAGTDAGTGTDVGVGKDGGAATDTSPANDGSPLHDAGGLPDAGGLNADASGTPGPAGAEDAATGMDSGSSDVGGGCNLGARGASGFGAVALLAAIGLFSRRRA